MSAGLWSCSTTPIVSSRALRPARELIEAHERDGFESVEILRRRVRGMRQRGNAARDYPSFYTGTPISAGSPAFTVPHGPGRLCRHVYARPRRRLLPQPRLRRHYPGTFIVVGAYVSVLRHMLAQCSLTLTGDWTSPPLGARRPASRISLSDRPDSSTRRGGPPVHVGGRQRLRLDEDPLAFVATPRAAEAHDDRREPAGLLARRVRPTSPDGTKTRWPRCAQLRYNGPG